jgi:hypothetical protein
MSREDPPGQEKDALRVRSIPRKICWLTCEHLILAEDLQEVEDARIAIRDSVGMVIDGRKIRAEHAKVDR